MLTCMVVGRNIAPATRISPKEEANVNIALLENFAPKEAPVKRPIIIRNQ